MVTHRSLMHNQRMIQAAFGHSGTRIGVSWLPLYHDMGLIGSILQAVFIGGSCLLMSPLAFLQRPFRWLHAISSRRADSSVAPNFAYAHCTQSVTPEEKASLDLTHWSVAAVGSDPISSLTLEQFGDTFAKCGFRPEAWYPCYGLAEATLFVTGGTKTERPVVRTVSAEALARSEVVDARADAPDARRLVGCGRPWLDQQILVVHPELRVRMPAGMVGEIWVAGDSVAQGYWNRAEETERAFRARLADTGEGPWLRTGDLGFVRDGELFITGRLKDVIVIRGRNYDPQDIEATIQTVHPGLRANCGAVFETGADGQPRLIVVQELDRRCRELDLTKLRGEIRKIVAARHDLHVDDIQFLEPGGLLKTSSGKVQRHACRASYERGTLRRWRGT
jgi:acyl-CoA synthetase (AMP-forming)/AMP-acid ligase II